ncbi:MAG: sugar transferase [Bdellovibrio sp. ArHS]|uniref:sugar transferase n=1 Tax=Bdellovibrio sp. ArHS TaxID=1569284 RepID=UPI000583C562|nr:sugar transferase [Bdellovibrio sp. ArHS]KHD89999.1 MAG: sugar transferase [Bdellovibrio sp. ArHS]
MKRLLDIFVSFFGLLALSPILLPVMFFVWKEDKGSPFYRAPRVGKDGKIFRMLKMRSMRLNADKTGVNSTSASDPRITQVGHFIRKWKIDEITQLWNVLVGDMSLVGPRPNVKVETDAYNETERQLLSIDQGITDFASIVYSDEGDILNGASDPDYAYHHLIRPGKIKLGLFYVHNRTFIGDICIILLTLVAPFSRETALNGVQKLLKSMGADDNLLEIASRKTPLIINGATR